MNYDPITLAELIIDKLEEELTVFNNWFEFKDCIVQVTGHVHQEFRYDKGDFWTPSEYVLVSRLADFDEILIGTKDEDRALTYEEIAYIEKLISL